MSKKFKANNWGLRNNILTMVVASTWSFMIFPESKDRYDMNGFHLPYDFGRLIETP